MSEPKLYAERAISKAPLWPHYMRHLNAMTAEDLRSKSDIAAELAFRDAELARLREALSQAVSDTYDLCNRMPDVYQSEFDEPLARLERALASSDHAPAPQPPAAAGRTGSLAPLGDAAGEPGADGRQVGCDGPAGGGAADGAGEGEAGRAAEGGAEAGLTWRLIESAPKDRCLLLGFRNELGYWRTTRGIWLTEGELEERDDYGDVDEYVAGWHEDPVEGEECYLIKPTHWMPFPEPPSPGAAGVGGGEVPVDHHCTKCGWQTTALYTPRQCRECGQDGMEPKS